jgi:hypothetical protein
MDNEEVWIQKPLDVLRRVSLLPNETDDFAKRFNTLTRLLIVVCIVLAVVKWKYWYVILIAGLFILFNSYLSQTNFRCDREKMKTYVKNNAGIKSMTDKSVTSYYTVERVVDDRKGVSLQQVAAAPREAPVSEVITMAPKIVTQKPKHKKPTISMGPSESQIRIKTRSGAKIVAPPKKKDPPQPDFMKIAFEDLPDGAIADRDSENLDSLML